jgi:hypothetical protein
MNGFSVVLVDNVDPSEGDFVHVESFPTFADLLDFAAPWKENLLAVARRLELRDADERISITLDGAEIERFFPSELREASERARELKAENPTATIAVVL